MKTDAFDVTPPHEHRAPPVGMVVDPLGAEAQREAAEGETAPVVQQHLQTEETDQDSLSPGQEAIAERFRRLELMERCGGAAQEHEREHDVEDEPSLRRRHLDHPSPIEGRPRGIEAEGGPGRDARSIKGRGHLAVLFSPEDFIARSCRPSRRTRTTTTGQSDPLPRRLRPEFTDPRRDRAHARKGSTRRGGQFFVSSGGQFYVSLDTFRRSGW
jgi:hypothetical protein